MIVRGLYGHVSFILDSRHDSFGYSCRPVVPAYVEAGTVLPLTGEHDHTDVVVGIGAIEGGVELVDQLSVLCVGGLGPVERDRAHGPVDLVPDRPERPRFS